jgi:hypothetical protein
MQALVRFSHIAAGDTFTNADPFPGRKSAGFPGSDYSLGSLRYELSKLRSKGLVEKVPTFTAVSIAGAWLSGLPHLSEVMRKNLCSPYRWHSHALQGDDQLSTTRKMQLDRLYRAVLTSLDRLLDAVGLKAA